MSDSNENGRWPLPEGWVWTKLGEVCDVNMGQSPPSTTYNSEGIGLPFYQGKAEFGSLYPTPVKWCSQPQKISQAGDILLSVRAPVGATNLNRETSCIGRGLAAIKPPAAMNNLYFLYYLRYSEQDLIDQATGTTFQAVSGKVVRNHLLPLAPLPDQHRIVAEIEKQFTRLDAAVAALRRAKANLARYKAAVLKAAVEGRLVADRPQRSSETSEVSEVSESASDLLARILAERRAQWEAANPKKPYVEPKGPDVAGLPGLPVGWVWATLGDIAEVGTGATPRRDKSEYYRNGTIPWLTSSVVNQPYVDEADVYITQRAIRETNAKIFPAGTLLMAMYGEGKTRGKVTEMRLDAATNQACAALQFSGLAEQCKNYAKLFLLSNYEETRRMSSGGVQPNINLSIVRETLIPLPPGEEQVRIVAEAERLLSLIDSTTDVIEANLARAERLRQGVLGKAFRGELVANGETSEVF